MQCPLPSSHKKIQTPWLVMVHAGGPILVGQPWDAHSVDSASLNSVLTGAQSSTPKHLPLQPGPAQPWTQVLLAHLAPLILARCPS